MTNKLALSFRLVDINTEEFAILEDGYTKDGDTRLGTFLNFGMDPEHYVLSSNVKFQFEQNEKPFLIISATCSFELEKEAWDSLLNEDNDALVIPEGFTSHMAVITVGTVRGILHEKTRDTPFNDYIIPPINLTELIKEDLVLPFEEQQ